MRFKENYIRKIIQEEIATLNDDGIDEPVEVNRGEMSQVWANIESIISKLQGGIPSTEMDALQALNDLEQLSTWFDAKLTGGEDPEGMEWLREPSKEEEEYFKRKYSGKGKLNETYEGAALALGELKTFLMGHLEDVDMKEGERLINKLSKEFGEVMAAYNTVRGGAKRGETRPRTIEPRTVSGVSVRGVDESTRRKRVRKSKAIKEGEKK
jgi:hypothetical protein